MLTCVRFIVVLALVVAWPTVTLAQKPRAELAKYELGDQWFRNDGVFDLIRIEPDRYVFADGTKNREVHLTKELAVIKAVGGSNWVEMSPPMRLTWPLEAGKWGVTQDAKWRSHTNPPGIDVRLS